MVDIVFRSEEYAIFEDIPRFKGMGAAGIGGERINDLAISPGPEAFRILRFWDGQIDANLGVPFGMQSRRTILPGFGIVADSIIQGIEHTAGFVEIAYEHIVAVLQSESSYLSVGKFRLGQQAPIAGGFGQFRRRAAGEHVLIVAADVGDGIVTAIVTANHIAGLGHIPGAVRGTLIDPSAFLLMASVFVSSVFSASVSSGTSMS